MFACFFLCFLFYFSRNLYGSPIYCSLNSYHFPNGNLNKEWLQRWRRHWESWDTEDFSSIGNHCESEMVSASGTVEEPVWRTAGNPLSDYYQTMWHGARKRCEGHPGSRQLTPQSPNCQDQEAMVVTHALRCKAAPFTALLRNMGVTGRWRESSWERCRESSCATLWCC